MIKFNKEKCIRCGQCANVCPFTIISTDHDYPAMTENKKDLCISCFHCMSACGQKAISAAGVRSSDVRIDGDAKSEGAVKRLIQGRRSVRRFNGRNVDRELVKDVLQAAEWAPSAKNQHPARWIAVHGKDKTDEIMRMVLNYVEETGKEPLVLSEYSNGNNIVTFGAPCLLFVYADTSAINPFADSVIAMTMADLMFHEKGIETCWGGYMIRIANNCKAIREYLGLPQGCQVYGVLGLGYTDAEHYIYLPYRKEPRITWL